MCIQAMKKPLTPQRLLPLISLVLVVGVVLFAYQRGEDTKTRPQLIQTTPSSSAEVAQIGDLIIGDPSAPASMIEYGDYKCPSCADYHQEAWLDIKRDYVDAGKLKVIFRPYPVYGEDGAKAVYGSYCAAAQNKFEQYYTSIYDYMWATYFSKGDKDASVRPTLDTEPLKQITDSIGIDSSKFQSCVDEITYKTDYDQALSDAADDGVQGTPTFIINEQKVVGPQPYQIFKTLIDIQL